MIADAKLFSNQLLLLDHQIKNLLDIHTETNALFDKLIIETNNANNANNASLELINNNNKNKFSCFKSIELYFINCFRSCFNNYLQRS